MPDEPSWSQCICQAGLKGYSLTHSATTVEKKWTKVDLLLILTCLVLAILVRAPELRHDLSSDEVWILASSNGRANEMFERWNNNFYVPPANSPIELDSAQSISHVWTDGVSMHPPLYSVSLRGWREIWGDSRSVATSYSLACSLVALIFVFATIRIQASSAVATAVCLMLGLSIVQTHVSTEVRGYALLSMLIACSVWQAVRIEVDGGSIVRVWLLGLMPLFLMLTHYFAAGICIALCVWAWFYLKERLRFHFFLAVVCSAVVYLLIWAPFLIEHAKIAGEIDSFLERDDPIWKSVIPKAIDLPVRIFVYPENRAITVCLGLALGGLVVAGMRKISAVRVWGLMLFFGIGFVLIVDVARQTHHVSFMRYGALVSVAVPAALFLSIDGLFNKWLWPVTVAILVCLVLQLNERRDVGSVHMSHAVSEFLPVIAEFPAEYPVVSCAVGKKINPHGATTMMTAFASHPGFLPRASMVDLEVLSAHASETGTPASRFWLITVGRVIGPKPEQVLASLPPALQQEYPQVTVVDGPWNVRSGGWGISPRLGADLWLMEIPIKDELESEK